VDQHENWNGADAGHNSAQLRNVSLTTGETWHHMI